MIESRMFMDNHEVRVLLLQLRLNVLKCICYSIVVHLDWAEFSLHEGSDSCEEEFKFSF